MIQLIRAKVRNNLAWDSTIHLVMIITLFSLVYLIKVATDPENMNSNRPTLDKKDDSEISGQLPLIIEKNLGQAPGNINFFTRRGGYNITLNPDNFTLSSSYKQNSFSGELKFKFVGSNPNASMVDKKMLSSKSNYIRGKNPKDWIIDVPNYRSISYKNIYPGVDIQYYAKGSQLQYDFIVSPNTDPDIIKVRVDGVEQITTNEENNLELHFNESVVELDNLLAYQEIDNNKNIVDAKYNIISDNEFGFHLGEYDSDYLLVIDPVVQYSTYLGGNGSDQGNDIVVDGEGNAYIIGQTSSTNFPTSPGSYDEAGRKGGFFDPSDVFVIKMNSEGSDYIYSTYISGGDSDIGLRIAVDDNGNAYIIGTTSSVDDSETVEVDEGFPLVNAYQDFYGGDGDLFIAKLNPTGNQLLFSSYFGGESGDNTGQDKPGIALDSNGDIFISGTTTSLEFPTTAGVFKETGPGAFVSKFNNDGSSLLFSTFLGGDEFVFITDLAVTGDGKALVTGFTANPDLPTTVNAYQQEPANGEESFFYKLNQSGTGFEICSYFGGSGDDFAYGIDLDNSNNIYITGNTLSSEDFPLTTGSIPPSGAAYAAKFNSMGNLLIYSLPLGGDVGNDIAVDYADRASVVGRYYDGFSSDVVFSVVNSEGTGNIHETFLGGLSNDIGYAIDVDGLGNAYITGVTSSTEFPGQEVINQDPLLSSLSSPPDGFVVKIDMEYEPVESPYLSRDEAIDIFIAEYLEINPRSDSIAAYLYNRTEGDSLLIPGDIVEFFDSTFALTIDNFSYLFWVDHYPNMEFYHPTSMAVMNAVTGTFNIYDFFTWPILNGIELTEFAAANILSPNLFFGSNLFFGLPPIISYTPVERDNDADWAIILVSRNLSLDKNKFKGEKERRARINDIARVKEILNGVPLGPKLKDKNIIVVPGDDTLGATMKEICDVFDSLKGKACNKLYFFYLGHGSRKGSGAMILKDENFKYSELRKKLANSDAKEVCISIEACYSGKSTSELSKGTKVNGKTIYLKGKIITSSPGNKTTKREADGTPFYKGLNECYKDQFADLNESGDIDLFEAVAWAAALNEKVRKDRPQGRVLSREKNKHISLLPRYKYKEGSRIDRKLSGLCFELISARYKPIGVKEKDKDKLDSKGYYNRVALYVENKTRRHIRKKVEVTCTSGGKRTKHVVFIDLPPRDRDLTKKNPRQCLVELPQGCKNFDVKVLKQPTAFEKISNEPIIDTFMVPVSYSPGEYIFEPIIIDSTQGDIYTTSVSGKTEWNLSVKPSLFTFPSVVDSEIVITTGDIPLNETIGKSFFVTIDNQTIGKTEVFDYNLLLEDTSNAGISDNEVIENQLLYLKEDLTANNVEISNSVIVFPEGNGISTGSNSNISFIKSVITNDSTGEYGTSFSGEINVEWTNFNTPLEGLTLDSPSGIFYECAIYGSEDDGLKIYNDQSNLDINFLFIASSQKSGIYFENASSSTLRNVIIANSVDNDLSLNQNSNVVMIDSHFDTNKVSIDQTSTLTRMWSNSFAFFDANENPIQNAIVTITDFDKSITIVDTTDSLGLTKIHELVQYLAGGNNRTYHTPHTINFLSGDFDTTFTIVADSAKSHDVKFTGIVTGGIEDNQLPSDFSISQNYPNPFNPTTRIEYAIPVSGKVKIEVYDLLGNTVKVLVDEIKEEGYHEVSFDASNYASGVYFYRIESGSFSKIKKMVLLK